MPNKNAASLNTVLKAKIAVNETAAKKLSKAIATDSRMVGMWVWYDRYGEGNFQLLLQVLEDTYNSLNSWDRQHLCDSEGKHTYNKIIETASSIDAMFDKVTFYIQRMNLEEK